MAEYAKVQKMYARARAHGYEPLVRAHPLYGTLDVVLVCDDSKSAGELAEDVLSANISRMILDDDDARRGRLCQRFNLSGYPLTRGDDKLTRLGRDFITDKSGNVHPWYLLAFQNDESGTVHPWHILACQRVYAAYKNLNPDIFAPILAIAPPDFFRREVYELLCPSLVTPKMVQGLGFVVLNPKKSEEQKIEYKKAREAEDVPELRDFAAKINK